MTLDDDLDVVRKPWGYEYPCYFNEAVAIWALHMYEERATSLHCHPSKNTALVVLDGTVELSFIRGAPLRLSGLDKLNVFRGRFHRIYAMTRAILLEIEAPDDKRDLVRLEDDHGRAGQPIESATEARLHYHLWINDAGGQHNFSECSLRVIRPLTCDDISAYRAEHILVTLRGGLARGLLPPGDAVDGESLARMAASLAPLPGTEMLLIWRDR